MAQYAFNDVTFEAPGRWTDTSVISLVGAADGDFRPTVLVSRGRYDAPSLEAYAAAQGEEVKRNTKGYVQHRQGPTVVGHRNGYQVEHSFVNPDGVQVRQVQLFVVKQNTVVTVTVTHFAQSFEAIRAVANEIGRTLRVA